MAWPNVSIGPDARLSVGGVMFGIVTHSITNAGEKFDPADSESLTSGYRQAGTGINQVRMRFNCKRSTDVSPHIAPLNLTPRRGQYLNLFLYPDGLTGDVYNLPLFVLEEWTSQGDNSASNPQTIDFTGVNSDLPVLYGATI